MTLKLLILIALGLTLGAEVLDFASRLAVDYAILAGR